MFGKKKREERSIASAEFVLEQYDAMFPIAQGAAWPTPRALYPGERAIWTSGRARLVESRMMPPARHKLAISVAVPVDSGTVTLTTRRAIFDGVRKNREWLWEDVVGLTNDDEDEWVAISTTDREQMSGVAVDDLPAFILKCWMQMGVRAQQDKSAVWLCELQAQYKIQLARAGRVLAS